MKTYSCTEIRERLWDLLDGVLDEWERVTVKAHLSSCAACQEEAEDRRRLWAMLALDEAPAGRDLTARIVAAAAVRPWTVVHHHWLRWGSLAAAASLLIVFSLSILFRHAPVTPPTDQPPIVKVPADAPREKEGYLETQLVNPNHVSDLELLAYSDYIESVVDGKEPVGNGT